MRAVRGLRAFLLWPWRGALQDGGRLRDGRLVLHRWVLPELTVALHARRRASWSAVHWSDGYVVLPADLAS